MVDDIPSQDQLANEMVASLYHTAQTRLRYYLTVRENTESKFYENYLAYTRKTKPRKFSNGEKVLFRYPEQHGLVLLPNCEGVVSEVLPCDYYTVSYKLPNGKEASTVLYSSMMVGMHGCVPSHATADEYEYKIDFVSKIRHFALFHKCVLHHVCYIDILLVNQWYSQQYLEKVSTTVRIKR